MAATIFEIIAVVFIVLFLFILMIILPLINKMLKGFNRSFSEKTRDIKDAVGDSIEDFETAEKEIAEIQEFTVQIKNGLDSAIEAADLGIDFLGSPYFRYGFPAAVWALFAFVALPRGLWSGRTIKVKPQKRKVIPPPSWEA